MLIVIFFAMSISADAQTKEGLVAPKINITNWLCTEQKPIDLKGKFIVLEFWATWCAPCLAALPHMNNLQNKFKDKQDLRFLSISDEKPEKIRRILPNFNFKSIIITDTTGITQKSFDIFSLPRTVLIDKNGIIRWLGNPTTLTSNILNDFLNGRSLSNEKKITDTAGSLSDSLFKYYREIFDDPKIDTYFNANTTDMTNKIKSISRIGTHSYNEVRVGVSIKSLFSNLLNCTENQIKLPNRLKNKVINYCFKYKYKSDKQNGKEVLLNKLIQKFNLKKVIKDEIQETIVIEVVDSLKLNQVKVISRTSGIRGSSVSDNSKVISINNNSLEVLIDELTRVLNMPIEFKDISLYPGLYDITINNNSFNSLKQSMSLYGLKLSKSKKLLNKYIFQ
jgi:thiol-disulfide isomerase/thioredoxin